MWKTPDSIACHLWRYHRRKWSRHATGRWITVVGGAGGDSLVKLLTAKEIWKAVYFLLSWFNANKHNSRMEKNTKQIILTALVILLSAFSVSYMCLFKKPLTENPKIRTTSGLLVQTQIVNWQWRKFPGYSLDKLSPHSFVLFL